jgi:predicted HAD superfamily Cof-like phosphohydrolase
MSMKFYSDIEKFNQIYKLPCNDQPVLLGPDRIENFRDILAEEVEEANDISDKYQAMLQASGGTLNPEQKLEILTDMSDWLGDIVVYCASEAKRWGLPLDEILNVIMQSNFSKLDANGEPIYDERGKVMKGPNYWKPEPKISQLLSSEK